MFTGLIDQIGEVHQMHNTPTGARLGILAPGWPRDARAGESIAINGCCLTLVVPTPANHDTFDTPQALLFDVIPQSLALTTMGLLRVGDRVNLERSLRTDALLGGHMVQGHIDTVAQVVDINRDHGAWRTRVQVAPQCMQHLVTRGSIAVDGVSLTVAEVGADWFEVALIPETLQRTTLATRLAGSQVNLEFDVISKMVAAQVQWYLSAHAAPHQPATPAA